ncbi:MAG TPA: MATE family efflux transporter [Candidatus Latescibacteria bacterium]|nr:MATE family efflux transporter [Candidatus Latescibacterota bacterium]
MTDNGLDRPILRLALPSMLAAISVPLIGLVDTAMVGHLSDVAFLGAVATASLLFDVLFWSAGFLRMGTTSIVSQYYGAGDRANCTATLYRALLLAAMIGLLVLLLRDPLSEVGFVLVGGTDEVQIWGQRYFDVRVFGVPLVLATLALNGFFLGVANVVAPLLITVVANVVNVAADYALIFGHWGAPELGVVGAAWASVLANGVGFVVGLSILLARYHPNLSVPSPAGLLDPARLRHLFDTNVNLLGRTLCLLFAQFSLVALVARMGDVPLAAHTVVWQLWALVSYGVDGFAHAAEALVGSALGSGNSTRARAYARRILGWGICIGLLFTVVYAVGLEFFVRILTSHAEVAVAAGGLTILVAVMQPLNAVVFIFDGIFIGANDMAYMFRAMALAAFAFFVPAVVVLVIWLDGGLLSAWIAYAALMVGRALPLALRYRTDTWLRTFVHSC